MRVWFRRTLGSRRDETGKLNRLACGVTVDYVDSLFGPLPFRFSGPADKAAQAPGVALLSERIYRLKHAWVRVTAGFDGSVRAFSITVTDPLFKFRTRHLTFDTLDVRLGATRFRALAHAPDGWLSLTGARRSAYAESHWFGNPGSYQVYVLGYNDAGTGHYEMPPPLTIGATANAPHVMGGRPSATPSAQKSDEASASASAGTRRRSGPRFA